MKDNLLSIEIFFLEIMGIIYIFTDFPLLRWVIALILFIIVFVSLLRMRGFNLILALFFLLSSIGISFYAHSSWQSWFLSLNQNITLLTLLISVPFLSIPLVKGGFEPTLMAFYEKKIHSEGGYLGFSTLLTYLLGIFVNVAAVPLVLDLTDSQSKKYSSRLIAAAITRAYPASLIFTPNSVAFGSVLYYMPVTWGQLAPGVLLLSFLFLGVGFIIERPSFAALPMESAPETVIDWKKLGELLLTGLVIIIAILAIHYLLSISVIESVPLVSLTLPFIWMFVKKKSFMIKTEFTKYVFSLCNLNNIIVIFATAGCFAQAISISGFDQMLSNFILSINFLPQIVINLIFLLVFIVSSVIGIHPIASGVVLMTAIDPVSTGLSTLRFAILILCGWGLAVAVSPVSVTNVLTAHRLDREAGEIGTLWNIPFALVTSLIVAIVLSISSI